MIRSDPRSAGRAVSRSAGCAADAPRDVIAKSKIRALLNRACRTRIPCRTVPRLAQPRQPPAFFWRAADRGAWAAATSLSCRSTASRSSTRVIAVLRPQCDALLVSANGDPARFAAYGLPVVADDVPDFAGPLAGILAGLDFIAAYLPEMRFAVSAASDTPFLPNDLVARLHQSARDGRR